MSSIGIKITLPDSEPIEVYFNKDKECILSIDDRSFKIYYQDCPRCKALDESDEVGFDIDTIDFIDEESFIHNDSLISIDSPIDNDSIKNGRNLKANSVRARCVTCNGRTFCIEQGCIKTPCGKICN